MRKVLLIALGVIVIGVLGLVGLGIRTANQKFDAGDPQYVGMSVDGIRSASPDPGANVEVVSGDITLVSVFLSGLCGPDEGPPNYTTMTFEIPVGTGTQGATVLCDINLTSQLGQLIDCGNGNPDGGTLCTVQLTEAP